MSETDSPNNIIKMDKIFVNADKNGGNDVKDLLHVKNHHRKPVINKVIEYLK